MRTTSDGLITVPLFAGNDWTYDELRAPQPPTSMIKAKLVPPRFAFMIAKRYEVAPEQALSAEVLVTSIMKATYERMFEQVQYARTSWVDGPGGKWFEAAMEMRHKSMGSLAKIERVLTLGPKVFLVSAEGRQEDIAAVSPFATQWIAEARFAELGVTAPSS